MQLPRASAELVSAVLLEPDETAPVTSPNVTVHQAEGPPRVSSCTARRARGVRAQLSGFGRPLAGPSRQLRPASAGALERRTV